MNNKEINFAWLGWIVAFALGVILIFSIINNDSNKSDATNTAGYTSPSAQAEAQPAPSQTNAQIIRPDVSWQCVDATSYNRNAYDDNKCSNGSEERYVSDSEARSLDPSYSPGQTGATYYNNR